MSTAYAWLGIKVGSDPISGSVFTSDKAPAPFCGWVELAAAIEAIRAPRAPEPDPRGDPAKN